jgi:hypothetical protein
MTKVTKKQKEALRKLSLTKTPGGWITRTGIHGGTMRVLIASGFAEGEWRTSDGWNFRITPVGRIALREAGG